MEYKISKDDLHKAINFISAISRTTLLTPEQYAQEIQPFVQKLQNLEEIKEED